jgi:Protein of unknown function (DUF2442)
MERIIEVKPLDNCTVWVRFSDNYDAVVNLKPFISSGISTKLLDSKYFKQVKIDEFGGICWDNGFDFCPISIRQMAQG